MGLIELIILFFIGWEVSACVWKYIKNCQTSVFGVCPLDGIFANDQRFI